MPGFCCVSSNKQQKRCNGCPVHSISKRNYEASSRNLSFLTFVSPAFVVSSVLQLSPAQSASRIPKPCDWLRKIRAHAGPDRVQQWLALTEENRRQREIHGVGHLVGLYILRATLPTANFVSLTREAGLRGQ